MRLLDTDVLIDIQRGHPPAVLWFASLTEVPCVPGFVVMELIQSASDSRQVKGAMLLVAPLAIVWPTESDCTQALAHFSRLHLSHGLGLIDSLVAACGTGRSAQLCTFNLKHYRAVPELVTEQPYVR